MQNIATLERIIKFKPAIKALLHVINRSNEFNRGYYPFVIKVIGIGGSSIRTETPRDIDIYIKAETRPEIWDEWNKFRNTLSENINLLLDLLWEVQQHKRRAQIKDIFTQARKALLKQGITEKQFDTWFEWLRISDINFGVAHGVPIVDFSSEKLLSRFLTAGWKRRRIEIHSEIFDVERKIWIVNYRFPHIVIWKKEEGILIPTEEEIERFAVEEYESLKNLATRILGKISKRNLILQDIPSIYHQAILLLMDEDGCTYKQFRKEEKELASRELEEVKYYLQKKLTTSADITNFRTALKNLALIGKINEKISNLKIDDIEEILKAEDSDKKIKEIISRRLRSSGFWKQEIVEILDQLDLKMRYKDFCSWIDIKGEITIKGL